MLCPKPACNERIHGARLRRGGTEWLRAILSAPANKRAQHIPKHDMILLNGPKFVSALVHYIFATSRDVFSSVSELSQAFGHLIRTSSFASTQHHLSVELTMTLLWKYLALMFLALVYGVDAYMIDDDCGGKCSVYSISRSLAYGSIHCTEDTNFVAQKIDSAFRLIATAVSELDKSPINTDVDNWFNTLFGDTATALRTSHRQNYVLGRMRQLAAIQSRTDSDQTNFPSKITDVRFYCTTNRIVKRSDGGLVNKDRGNRVYDPEELESKFASCYNLKPPTLMMTMTFIGEYNEIQICPWFLRKSRGFKFTDLQDTSQPFYAFISRLAIPVLAMIKYKPIDALVLMDKVIVHELTHTSQAAPATRDMTNDSYGKQTMSFSSSRILLRSSLSNIVLTVLVIRIGFKNARRMLQNWQAERKATEDPIFNADSNALFAVGTWIIIKTGLGIGTDGSFSKPSGNPKLS